MKSAWLCHPVTVAGVLVLLVNDHLLKQAWPGFVTGKLSDVAGLVVAPALLAMLFWRRADLAATVLTGLLFTLVKSTETGAELASQAWTLVAGPSRVLADSTDLLALPALALAWWVRHRSLQGPGSARWRVLVTMPLAVLAVAATSAAQVPTAHSVEVDDDDRIIVRVSSASSRVSEDGGVTWSELSYDSTDKVRPGQSAACVPKQATRCYRVVANRMAVEQSDDGGRTWGPSWAMSENDVERLERTYSGLKGRTSMGLAVLPRPEGHVVVVANGLDGILVRDVRGTWQRLGWPGASDEEAAEAEFAALDLSSERNVALFLGACMLFGGIGAGLRRLQRVFTGFSVATCLGLFLALTGSTAAGSFGGHSWLLADLDTYTQVAAILVSATVAIVGALTCLVLVFAGRARPATVAVSAGAAPLVYASVYFPFSGWAAGFPDAYGVAVAVAVLLTALVILTSVALLKIVAPPYLDGSSTSRPT
ncbi:hypothetical protein SAMN05444920_104449 [Nonomuraea solani]|uniref:Uncharacterized protein n=1 Tax=Nonomuraea solani TaxID=1144553 RepID=A0A1H6CVQ3_9ACTN|nr:hypothetical protein SAMN05444920_104449 [Nonomuraea solani]